MNLGYLLTGITSLLVLSYLVYVLIKPERF